MRPCPDCATPELCRAANYDCGHERTIDISNVPPGDLAEIQRRWETTTMSDGTIGSKISDLRTLGPAHYAVYRLWRETCNSIKEVEIDAAYHKSQLAGDEAHLVTLQAAKRELEDHAAHNDWVLAVAAPTEGKSS